MLENRVFGQAGGGALQAVLRQLVRQEEEARFCWLNNMVF